MKKPSAKSLTQVVPFVALLYQNESILHLAEERLSRALGPVLKRSVSIPFDFTRYYCEEMGEDLKRLYLAFGKPFDSGGLPHLKGWTNRLEEEFARQGKRTINIDPGCLNLSRVVLASTKDAPHRIYLAEGVFGEVTLIFEKGSFRPLPWTYPDYRTEESLRFFNEVRVSYRTTRRRHSELLHATS